MMFSQGGLPLFGKLVTWMIPLWMVAVGAAVVVAILAGVFFFWKQR